MAGFTIRNACDNWETRLFLYAGSMTARAKKRRG